MQDNPKISDSSGQNLVDSTSRTHLLLAHLAVVKDLRDADNWLASRHLHLELSRDRCNDEFGQAAAMTVVTLARRASLSVSVHVETSNVLTLSGPGRGTQLVNRLVALGAYPSDVRPEGALIAIGEMTAVTADVGLQLQVTWDGWVAGVRPIGVRLAERHGCVLAAVSAAAMAVSEIFHNFLGHLDAGWRPLTLSLWDPLAENAEQAVGTLVNRLPTQWFLAGLGHLGQAYGWCLGLLPYEDGEGEVWLADDDHVTLANVSTGVLCTPSDAEPPARLKTRVVSESLESAGRTTRLLEFRIPHSYRWEPGQPEVALIGVDNLEFRKCLSDIGWPLAVDAGLGATPSSFSAMSIHVFPGTLPSGNIASWQNSRPLRSDLESAPAFSLLGTEGVDQCGVVMLAGQAVAAAFVGMTAACLAVSEPLRRLQGSVGLDALSVSLDTLSPRGAYARRDQRVGITSVRTESDSRNNRYGTP
jgi:hypothetical protein